MLCSVCNNNEAVCEKYIDSNVGKIKAYLCFDCLKKVSSSTINKQLEISDFWNVQQQSNCCPSCGTRLEDIEQNLMVGCKDCYNVFYDSIEKLINSYHGSSNHVGIVPEKILNKNADKLTEKSKFKKMDKIIEQNFQNLGGKSFGSGGDLLR